MNCFLWFHKWGKWKEITVEIYFTRSDRTETKQIQRRACERCGFIQEREI